VSIKVYDAYRVQRGVDPFNLMADLKRRGQQEARERLTVIFGEILSGASQAEANLLERQNELFTAWLKENHGEPKNIGSSEVFGLYREWMREHFPEELKRTTAPPKIAVHNHAILRAAGRKDADIESMKPGIFDIDHWMTKCYGDQLTDLQRNLWALDTSITIRKYRSRYYLIPYCERSSLVGGCLEFLDKDDRLEEFGYWNNTDKPAEVTTSQWAWRGKVWTALTDHERWKDFLCVDVVSYFGFSDVSPALELLRKNPKEEAQRLREKYGRKFKTLIGQGAALEAPGGRDLPTDP